MRTDSTPGEGTPELKTCSLRIFALGSSTEPPTVLNDELPGSQRNECVTNPEGELNLDTFAAI